MNQEDSSYSFGHDRALLPEEDSRGNDHSFENYEEYKAKINMSPGPNPQMQKAQWDGRLPAIKKNQVQIGALAPSIEKAKQPPKRIESQQEINHERLE